MQRRGKVEATIGKTGGKRGEKGLTAKVWQSLSFFRLVLGEGGKIFGRILCDSPYFFCQIDFFGISDIITIVLIWINLSPKN